MVFDRWTDESYEKFKNEYGSIMYEIIHWKLSPIIVAKIVKEATLWRSINDVDNINLTTREGFEAIGIFPCNVRLIQYFMNEVVSRFKDKKGNKNPFEIYFDEKDNAKISKQAKNERVVQYSIDIITSSDNTESIITGILEDTGMRVAGCMSNNISWNKKEYEQLTGIEL